MLSMRGIKRNPVVHPGIQLLVKLLSWNSNLPHAVLLISLTGTPP